MWSQRSIWWRPSPEEDTHEPGNPDAARCRVPGPGGSAVEALKLGTAVIIWVFPAGQRLAVEQSLPGSPLKSVVESDEKGIEELTGALGEAMGKFNPDRTVLPIPDRAFGGVLGRSIDESVADRSIHDLKPAPIDEQAELHRTASQAGMAHGAAG